jgi:phosphatidylglycerol:prolipoprotein diacylglycerol transferase
MAELPFLHPALLGVAVAGTLAWAAVVPDRLRGVGWALGCGALAAALAGLAGMVPWLGSIRFTAYGLLLLAAFAAGWWILRRRALTLGLDPFFVREQVAISAVAGVLGARVWYVVEYHREFPDPTTGFGAWLAQAADLDRGGAVWFGGLTLAVIAMAVHARRNRVAALPWADCAAPAVLAGLALGRIGCFLNGCCFGRHCDLPWGVTHSFGSLVVPGDEGRSVVQTMTDTVHPTQLYESVACAILALLVARNPPGSGRATGWALVGYACWRAFNEGLRGDYTIRLGTGQGFSLSPFHLTSAQLMALPLLALGIWLLWRARRAVALPPATPARAG